MTICTLSRTTRLDIPNCFLAEAYARYTRFSPTMTKPTTAMAFRLEAGPRAMLFKRTTPEKSPRMANQRNRISHLSRRSMEAIEKVGVSGNSVNVLPFFKIESVKVSAV